MILSCAFLCVLRSCKVATENLVPSGTSCYLKATSADKRTETCLRRNARTFFLYRNAPDTDEPLSFFKVIFVRKSYRHNLGPGIVQYLPLVIKLFQVQKKLTFFRDRLGN